MLPRKKCEKDVKECNRPFQEMTNLECGPVTFAGQFSKTNIMLWTTLNLNIWKITLITAIIATWNSPTTRIEDNIWDQSTLLKCIKLAETFKKSWHCILNYSFSNKTSSWLTILGCKISYCKNCRLSHATRGIHFAWLGQGWSSVEMLDMRHTVPSASKCCDAYRDQTLGRRGCLFLSVLFKAFQK